MILKPGDLVAGYRIEEFIGEGGMGEVWRATHPSRPGQFALKAIHPNLQRDPQFAARFQLEAQRQAALQHPAIVQVRDFQVEGGNYYLVMDYIPGISLERRVRPGPLPVQEALGISDQILDALNYAHSHGIIHRDLKPGNILLSPDGRAYLTDFGIAVNIAEPRRTRTGVTVGTADYMSPEQILRPAQIDFRTDVYSFGCVLYEMLAGRPPFVAEDGEGDTDFRLKNMHVSAQPDPPRKYNPAIPRPLESVILLALAKDPEQRFPGTGSFATALRSISSAPDPVPAPAPSPAAPPVQAPRVKPPRLRKMRGGWNVFGHLLLLSMAAVCLAAQTDTSVGLFWSLMFFDGILFTLRPVYRGWRALRVFQDVHWKPRTSPGRAVGRLLIPVYSIFWMYQAFPGFASDFNALANRLSLPGARVSRVPYIAICLTWTVSWSLMFAAAAEGSDALGRTGLCVGGLALVIQCWVIRSISGAVSRLARAI